MGSERGQSLLSIVWGESFRCRYLLKSRQDQLNCSAPSINGEFCSINETGTVGRQEDNRFRNFVRGTRPACWRLRCQLLKALAHRACPFRACWPRAHGINTDAARAVFRSPHLRQQIDRGLARAIEAHARRAVIGRHRRYIDDCSFASLRHWRSEFRDEEVRRLDIERIDALEHFFCHFMRWAEWINPGIVD